MTEAVVGGGTGDARVDEALASLAGAAALSLSEQVGAYESVHRALQDTLASVDLD